MNDLLIALFFSLFGTLVLYFSAHPLPQLLTTMSDITNKTTTIIPPYRLNSFLEIDGPVGLLAADGTTVMVNDSELVHYHVDHENKRIIPVYRLKGVDATVTATATAAASDTKNVAEKKVDRARVIDRMMKDVWGITPDKDMPFFPFDAQVVRLDEKSVMFSAAESCYRVDLADCDAALTSDSIFMTHDLLLLLMFDPQKLKAVIAHPSVSGIKTALAKKLEELGVNKYSTEPHDKYDDEARHVWSANTPIVAAIACFYHIKNHPAMPPITDKHDIHIYEMPKPWGTGIPKGHANSKYIDRQNALYDGLRIAYRWRAMGCKVPPVAWCRGPQRWDSVPVDKDVTDPVPASDAEPPVSEMEDVD